MRVRIAWRISGSPRPHGLLRWFRNAFLGIGFLALGYSGFVVLDAKLFQFYQTHLFEEQLKVVPSRVSTVAGVQEMAFHLPVSGALGQIEIPRLDIAAIVLEGTDDRTLRRAVGHIAGTALPGQQGNIGLAGHRDTFFRALRNIRKNDVITLASLDGVQRYRVISTRVVDPDEIEVLGPSSENILTLVTCYPFYFIGSAPKRFIVRAQAISE